jgi:polyhydroxyalkanoate synthesis regulator phasin
VVTGIIVDHAYKPMRGVEVFIRAGSDTTKAFTNPAGEFTGVIKDFQRIPGIYKVNVIASWYGMTGLTSTEFRVNGDVSPVSALQEKLSTEEARNYLGSQESDFEKNPIGQTLFKYYHGLLDELILEQKESREPNAEQIYLEQQRKIAENLRNQAIEIYNPSAGTFDGYQYDSYIDNLNPEIKDLIASQLNFTKNTFEEAQKLRDETLANGGTYEEARQAYLDMISMSKEVLEQFTQEKLDEISEDNQTEEDSEN